MHFAQLTTSKTCRSRSESFSADIPGYVPTALVGLTLDDALRVCDRLNAKLGLDRDAWSAIAGRAMSAAHDETTH